MYSEAGRYYGGHPKVFQRPHGVLPGRSDTKVGACHQHTAVRVKLVVENEVGVLAPGIKQCIVIPSFGYPLQKFCRDDLVCVDIALVQRNSWTFDGGDFLHYAPTISAETSEGLESVPLMAVAAATMGDTKWVLPPLPWRPSKLRLEVDAARSPGAN